MVQPLRKSKYLACLFLLMTFCVPNCYSQDPDSGSSDYTFASLYGWDTEPSEVQETTMCIEIDVSIDSDVDEVCAAYHNFNMFEIQVYSCPGSQWVCEGVAESFIRVLCCNVR